jgi:diguanylate cyclase (GGDEF)-like protein/PAS domain S-box-containing protein
MALGMVAALFVTASKAGRTIIERRRTEDALRDAALRAEDEKARTESIIAAIGDGINIVDTDFKIIYQNQVHRELAGDHLGEPCHRALEGRGHVCGGCPVAMTFDDGGIHRVQRCIGTEGGTLHVEITSSPLRDSSGRIIAAIEVVRDVTKRRLAEAEIKESEEKFRSLAEESPNMIFINKGGRIVYANRKCGEIVGYSREEFCSPDFDFMGLIAHGFRDLVRKNFASHMRGEEVPSYEYAIVTREGKRIEVINTTKLINYEGGSAILGIVTDITERKRVEEALRQSEEKFSNLFRHSNDGIILHDVMGNILDANQKALEQFGYAKSRFLSLSVKDLHPPEMLEKSESAFRRVARDGFVNMEITFRKENGDEFPAEVSSSMFEIAGRKVIQGIIRDITDRKRAEEQLERQAFYDQLTGLPNRVHFTKHLEHAVMRAKKEGRHLFAVLFMDLDRFKVINDSLGHLTGDQLLVAVAKRLEACVRPDDRVARLGGDEFAVLLSSIRDVSDAIRVAERIQRRLAMPFNLGGQEVFATASIGIAQSATGYDRAEDILRDADSAMYRAKAMGRTRYEMFDRSMHVSAMNLLQLEADLRRAVERGEFLVHYQPIVSLEDGGIKGVEALLGWQHPQRGLIPPMEFIPLAEDTGLIANIGEWVLRTACARAKKWHDAGYGQSACM